jgi:hypothetical protein
MNLKKIVICVLFLSSLCIAILQAQTTIPVSGGNATGTGGSLGYTVGQVVYTTYTGSNGTVSQGVQQPFEISVVTGLEEAKDISLEIIAYPNPASDFIKLMIKNYEVDNLSYQLYDVNGSILQDNKIEGQETNISMLNLKPSVYFLKVTDNKKVVKTFKIIKN